MTSKFSQKFTLIELLIVLIIVGLAMSTVAPAIHRSYEQQQMMLEVGRLKSYLKTYSSQAFTSQSVLVMKLEGNKTKVQSLNHKQVWQYLTFKAQEISYNKQGYSDSDTVILLLKNGRNLTINLPFALKNFANLTLEPND